MRFLFHEPIWLSQEGILAIGLLRENENRGKTPEQQIREGMTWEPIEEKKAEARQKAGTNLPQNFAEGGEVRNIIARRVGLGSGVTYEKGKEIVEYMDRMYQVSSERGDILRMTLNDESINAAHKLLKKYKQKDDDMWRGSTYGGAGAFLVTMKCEPVTQQNESGCVREEKILRQRLNTYNGSVLGACIAL